MTEPQAPELLHQHPAKKRGVDEQAHKQLLTF